MSLDRMGREFLHTPGPTLIPDRILRAMQRQPFDLADPRLLDMVAGCFEDLKGVFRTGGEVFAYAANGHGAWEAALANLFAPGDRLLVPDLGRFSREWGAHAASLGMAVAAPKCEPRRGIDPGVIEDALRADTERRIKGVLVVHIDTASGICSDLAAIRAAIDAVGHPALLVVDAIASLAAAPLHMDDWGVDVAVSASQKALMCPPGLAFVAANQRAREIARANPAPSYYWNWELRTGAEFYKRFCGTGPELGIFALREALDMLAEVGLEANWERHRRLAGAVHAAVGAWSEAGELFFNAVVPAERAVSVTVIRHTEGSAAKDLRDRLRADHDVALGGGLGDLSGQAFRIGHMGWLNAPMILGTLATVETGLTELGVAHESGVRAAIEHLAAEPAGAATSHRAA